MTSGLQVAFECLYTACAEEAFFRYGIFGFLDRRLRSPRLALVISSLAFGLAHLINEKPWPAAIAQIFQAIAMGAVLGYVYKRLGLWACILIHASYNFFVLFLLRML